ncbi:MAG: methyltransferase domain-containing protein [Ferruginibacter sp.]|nr:methyltransferase domain-containing protein [Ferruginibacter sp.]
MLDTWFVDWFNSPYYHQLYAHRDEQEASNFIDKLAAHLQPQKDAKVFDIACGKGRHSVQLAQIGFDVTGIDLSTESIAEAQKNEEENLHFYVHDMRKPFRINYFDITFNFFTSFGYFKTQREHDNAIKSFALSLKPGGIFVMDYLNVAFSTDKTIAEMQQQIGTTKYTISKWSDAHHFYKKIIVEDLVLAKPMQYTEKVAKFSLPNFEIMFAKQGLKIKQVFGDYAFGKYDEKLSPRLIMIAEKKI